LIILSITYKKLFAHIRIFFKNEQKINPQPVD